ncbi:MAG: hypothetical protein K2G18_05840 [Bacteroidales bacterium]|nr:hypothetical protein [Bacteroidales bacterium]
MEIFIAALILVSLCIIGLGVNIFFRKDGKFPETEIENNVQMRKRGIRCAKEEEMRIWGRKNGKDFSCSETGCSDCSAGCH